MLKQPRSKKLVNLLKKTPPIIVKGTTPDVKIRAVCSDSRQVRKGDAFLPSKAKISTGSTTLKPQKSKASA